MSVLLVISHICRIWWGFFSVFFLFYSIRLVFLSSFDERANTLTTRSRSKAIDWISASMWYYFYAHFVLLFLSKTNGDKLESNHCAIYQPTQARTCLTVVTMMPMSAYSLFSWCAFSVNVESRIYMTTILWSFAPTFPWATPNCVIFLLFLFIHCLRFILFY